MRLLILIGALIAAPASAQTPGACLIGSAQAELATPDLLAQLFNTGSLFFGNSTEAGYVVPRASGNSPIYAAALWVSGHVGGDVRAAAATYGNYQFWPGPLDAGAALPNPADCSAFDRIYVVSPEDVAAYDAGGSASDDLAAWPVGLGAPSVRASGQPVVVTSRTQVLDLAAGERPVLRGGPTAFWVMNDVGGARATASEQPLGIEVQVTAFAPASGAATLRQATVYRYTIVNRGAQTIDDLRVGVFMDPDLGDASDDYLGSDSTRGMGYVYNGRATDAQYGVPPAVGLDILSGAFSAPHLLKGVPFMDPRGEPFDPLSYHNRLGGLWNDGTVMRARGFGYGEPESIPASRFVYPGDPVVGQPWSEGSPEPGNSPSDRRLVVTALPVTLAPSASHTIDMGVLFAQGTDRLDSVVELRRVSDAAQAAYDSGALFPVASDGAPRRTEASRLGAVQPNPVRASVTVPYSLAAPGTVRLRLVDVLGRTVAVLADGPQAAGAHEARMDVRSLAAGVYAVVLEAGDVRTSRTVTVVR